ncbi:MAG: DAK2 domain-containing protein [Acidimicrobiales bacterium]
MTVVSDSLGAPQLCEVVTTYRDGLRAHQHQLNRLNVYPVPDGDTGTNMALTLESVTAELAQHEAPDMEVACRAIAHGSLMGARGNSGVILSQLLRGLCEGFTTAAGDPGPGDFSSALAIADKLAREAVMRPTEGTILTVARGAAEAARSASDAGASLLAVVEAARTGADEALKRTPSLLPVLERAGVVDAGGAGYVLFFDALLCVLDGRAMPEPEPVPGGGMEADGGATTDHRRGWSNDRRAGSPEDRRAAAAAAAASEDLLSELRYEVMYLLEAPDETIPMFKEVWAGLGDSIVVVGGDGLWNCHIHTDEIGAAVEASLDVGRPRNIRITDLLEEVEEERWVREAAETADSGPSDIPLGPAPVTAVVAVASGDGIARIFRSLGVQGIIAGGQSMNPSIAELVEAVDAMHGAEVIVLPNNGNIRPVADRVKELTEKQVWVVPTETIAEGFAALLAYDPGAHGEANAEAMETSARTVVPGEVTRAVRDADSSAGPISTGDWLGLSRDGIEVVGDTVAGAACSLLEVLVAVDHDLVTIIEGEGSGPAETRRITEWLRDHRPQVDTEVHHGGQPLYPYLFSIE